MENSHISSIHFDNETVSRTLGYIENFDTLLRCTICYDHFETCMVTQCSHNFCAACIRHHLVSRNRCPACFTPLQSHQVKPNRLVDDMRESFFSFRKEIFQLLSNVTPDDQSKVEFEKLMNLLKIEAPQHRSYIEKIPSGFTEERGDVEFDFLRRVRDMGMTLRNLIRVSRNVFVEVDLAGERNQVTATNTTNSNNTDEVEVAVRSIETGDSSVSGRNEFSLSGIRNRHMFNIDQMLPMLERTFSAAIHSDNAPEPTVLSTGTNSTSDSRGSDGGDGNAEMESQPDLIAVRMTIDGSGTSQSYENEATAASAESNRQNDESSPALPATIVDNTDDQFPTTTGNNGDQPTADQFPATTDNNGDQPTASTNNSDNSQEPSSSQLSHYVTCTACGSDIRREVMIAHDVQCGSRYSSIIELIAGSENSANNSAISNTEADEENLANLDKLPRQHLPTLHFQLMGLSELIRKCRSFGLRTDGNIGRLRARIRRFMVIYNIECDIDKPRPVSEIIRQVHDEEDNTSNHRLSSRRVRPFMPRETENSRYLRENKTSFDKLISDIRRRTSGGDNGAEGEATESTAASSATIEGDSNCSGHDVADSVDANARASSSSSSTGISSTKTTSSTKSSNIQYSMSSDSDSDEHVNDVDDEDDDDYSDALIDSDYVGNNQSPNYMYRQYSMMSSEPNLLHWHNRRVTETIERVDKLRSLILMDNVDTRESARPQAGAMPTGVKRNTRKNQLLAPVNNLSWPSTSVSSISNNQPSTSGSSGVNNANKPLPGPSRNSNNRCPPTNNIYRLIDSTVFSLRRELRRAAHFDDLRRTDVEGENRRAANLTSSFRGAKRSINLSNEQNSKRLKEESNAGNDNAGDGATGNGANCGAASSIEQCRQVLKSRDSDAVDDGGEDDDDDDDDV